MQVIIDDSGPPDLPPKRTKIQWTLQFIREPRQSAIASVELNHEIESPYFEPSESKQKLVEDDDASKESESDSDDDLDDTNDIFWSTEISPTEFQKMHVSKSLDECIVEMTAPQKSQAWLNARKWCITASQFGSALGNNPYQKPDQMLIDKIWSAFLGNEATAQGNLHEACAAASLQKFIESNTQLDASEQLYFREQGLLKHPDLPWMAVSPDGVLFKTNSKTKTIDWWVLEQKCPQQLRFAEGHPYSKYPFGIPTHYLNQIEGVMGYLNQTRIHVVYDNLTPSRAWQKDYTINDCSGALFVVWTPQKTHLTEQPFRLKVWTEMAQALKTFQIESMLPAFTHFFNGRLQEGTLSARETISLDKK